MNEGQGSWIGEAYFLFFAKGITFDYFDRIVGSFQISLLIQMIKSIE